MIIQTPSDSTFIQTVLGNISHEALGYCQCHEHIFIAKGKSFEINHSLWMDDLDASIRELQLYRKAGGISLVDAQPIGCGRMEDYLVKASQMTGINIIASTGFHKLIFYYEDHWIHKLDEDSLVDIFTSELQQGLFVGTDFSIPSQRIGQRAGIIKCAVDSFGIKGEYVKLFNAAAQASLSTGFPLMCHMEKGAEAFKIIDFFAYRGIDPRSVILCHLDRTRYDVRYHKEIAGLGVFLEYDTIARFKYHDNETEIRLIAEMVSEGYGDRILLGLDTTRERLKGYGGDVGLDYILKSFIPMLYEAGISREAIKEITEKNPQRALRNKKRL